MDLPELCDKFLCVHVGAKELVPKRHRRGCSCHISTMQQGRKAGRILCSNFDQQWPFKAEQGVQYGHCPVQIQQPRELSPGGQCQAGTARPPSPPSSDDRGSLIELAGSHSLCPNFPQDK